jgi:hypothetical protein
LTDAFSDNVAAPQRRALMDVPWSRDAQQFSETDVGGRTPVRQLRGDLGQQLMAKTPAVGSPPFEHWGFLKLVDDVVEVGLAQGEYRQQQAAVDLAAMTAAASTTDTTFWLAHRRSNIDLYSASGHRPTSSDP